MSRVGAHDCPASRERTTPPTWTLTWMVPSRATAIDRTSAGSPRRVPFLTPLDGVERLDGLQRVAEKTKEVSLRGADQQAIRRRRQTRRRSVIERRSRIPLATGAVPQGAAIDDRPGLLPAPRERGDGSRGELIDRLEGVTAKLPEPALGSYEDSRVHTAIVRLVAIARNRSAGARTRPASGQCATTRLTRPGP